MKILDCEYVDSIFQSLENILEIPIDSLRSFIDETDLDPYYVGNQDCYYSGYSAFRYGLR